MIPLILTGVDQHVVEWYAQLASDLGGQPPSRPRLDDWTFAEKYLKGTPAFPAEGPGRWVEPAPMHRELSSLADRHRRLIIQEAREHGKSTQFTFIRPLRLISENQNLRIVIISKTGEVAAKFVAAIGTQLETNARLIADYGGFRDRGSKWTDAAITVTRSAAFKEPTLQAVGRGGQIVSGRYDLVIVDDVEDYESTRTDPRRLATFEWLMRDVVPVVIAQGQILLIQTPQHEGDLVGQVRKNPLWHVIRIPAETDVPEAPGWLKRVSAWPAKWPIYWDPNCDVAAVERRGGSEGAMATAARDACARCPIYDPTLGDTKGMGCLTGKRFEVGETFYRLQYQCDVKALGGEVFKEQWFRYYPPQDVRWDAGRWIYHHSGRTYPIEIFMGIDPAIADEGEKDPDAHSRFALVVLGYVRPLRRRLLLHFENLRVDWPSQVRVILEQFDAWHPEVVAVEEVAYQRALRQELQRHHLPVQGVRHDTDKYRRIVAVSPEVEAGNLYLKAGPDGEPSPQEEFMAQAVRFPRGTHTDVLDAYALASEVLVGQPIFADLVRPVADPMANPHVIVPPAPKPGDWSLADILARARRGI